jgi:mRNA interferase RelE/StbE
LTDPWEVHLSPQAVKALDRLSRIDRERLTTAIALLPNGDVKRMAGSLAWRLRVGDWRVVFEIDYPRRRIDVLKVAPRGSAYKK